MLLDMVIKGELGPSWPTTGRKEIEFRIWPEGEAARIRRMVRAAYRGEPKPWREAGETSADG
jgi:hypothetical protein